MKKAVTNEFSSGLNLDLHPIVTPNTVLTDNLNGTFITYNGNEFCLQNDMGNTSVGQLTEGYIPIGIKEYNGILYIVSVNGNSTEIGTFGSPDWMTEGEGEEGSKVCPEIDLNPVYSPLYILCTNSKKDDTYLDSNERLPFRVTGLDYDTEHPVTIEIQPSYDGSVNLILTDGKNEPRIVNSGFSVLPNNKAKIIFERNQIVPTNRYNQEDIVEQLSLIRSNTTIVNVDLVSVQSGGQFKGGNYKFYIKFGDADYNQTDVVAESGIVSIFNGNDGVPSTISGTILDERTDKMIQLRVRGLNKVYSKIYIYYSREYSDTLGYRMTESGMFVKPIDMDNTDPENEISKKFWLTGFEETQPIDIEELNVDYHTIDSAKAQAQQANMLFLGNVGQSETYELYKTLKKKTLNEVNTVVGLSNSIGKVNNDFTTSSTNIEKSEYYSTKNIYYNLGYWPDEWYRFGIVYILKDGSTTPVFNMRGGILTALNQSATNTNEYGIFKTPRVDVLSNATPLYFKFTIPNNLPEAVTGWFVVRQKRIPTTICQGLRIGIDKRSHLPITWNGKNWITQSFLSSNRCYIQTGNKQSDINYSRQKNQANTNEYEWIRITDANKSNYRIYINGSNLHPELEYHGANTSDSINNLRKFIVYKDSYNTNDWYRNGYGLLSLDPSVNNQISSMLDGSEFTVRLENLTNTKFGISGNERYNYYSGNVKNNSFNRIDEEPIVNTFSSVEESIKCVYVPQNTGVKVISNETNNSDIKFAYSTVAGNASETNNYKYCAQNLTVYEEYGSGNPNQGNYFRQRGSASEYKEYVPDNEDKLGTKDYEGYNTTHNINLIRGNFAPFVGLASNNLYSHGIYSIRTPKVNDSESIKVRESDNSEYYTISERYDVSNKTSNIYGGDCYFCTVAERIITNFVDNTAPTADVIVDPNSWEVNVRQKSRYGGDAEDGGGKDGEREVADYTKVNLTDVNTVDLGYWVSYKCLSSYNLGLRSVDSSHSDEYALMGSPRSFYPLNGGSTATGNKMQESYLLNDGLSATVGRKRYNLLPDVPYSKSEFANRIMFSNVHMTDAFTNGYRTFQGLSYKDYDKQYGEITKLVSWGQNIFIVMEHGLGLIPVNEKALMQTTTGEAIHIYGYGVLPNEMSIVSQDFGSKYEESVVRTPIGIYGIDTDARKIWRFTDKQGFETISDMKIESLLNDTINSNGYEINMPNADVRTFYNIFKGDLIFTWNNKDDNKDVCVCFNERQNIWTTKYDWKPIVSENKNGEFYSLQFDESDDQSNQVSIWQHELVNSKPTFWYNKQHGFEFEFVVSDPIGVSKIFDDLEIISNNVQPNEMEITVIGDDYTFKRDLITADVHEEIRPEYDHNFETTSNLHHPITNTRFTHVNGLTAKKIRVVNQTGLTKLQVFKDIYKFGRRLGNIQYKEGVWHSVIEPFWYANKQVRIRDKWAKIRIRYSGENLAVITAIRTMLNV